MTSLLATLRDTTPQPTPAKFLHWQPGCWIQYYDDTAAKDPAKALSVPTFDPVIAERKQREHCAVGFSLQAFAGGRTREKFLSYRNLGVDVDLVRAPERWSLATAEIDRRKEEYLEQCLRPFPLRPHWLIETRHGFHAIFRVIPLTESAAVRAADELNRRLVRALRGDENAVLLTQVLRVPGTYQFKDPAHPFLCRLLQDLATTIKPYPLDVVRHALAGQEPPSGAGSAIEQLPTRPAVGGGNGPRRSRVCRRGSVTQRPPLSPEPCCGACPRNCGRLRAGVGCSSGTGATRCRFPNGNSAPCLKASRGGNTSRGSDRAERRGNQDATEACETGTSVWPRGARTRLPELPTVPFSLLPLLDMPTNEEWRRILERADLTDAEVVEFVESLRTFIGRVLDDYFRDEFGPDEV